MDRRYWIPVILGAAVGIGAGVYVANQSDDTQSGVSTVGGDDAALADLQSRMQNTLVLPEDFRAVPEFSLLGKDGSAVDQTLFDDQWTAAFFGYTYCPDVCPITLQVMKDVVSTLEAENTPAMQVAFFTVDPNRDTVERMNEYVGFFDDDFRGVTGELNDVLELTKALGIVAAFTANDEDPENYLVDHTASMLLVDPQGRVRARFRAPHDVNTIVADYREILAALN